VRCISLSFDIAIIRGRGSKVQVEVLPVPVGPSDRHRPTDLLEKKKEILLSTGLAGAWPETMNWMDQGRAMSAPDQSQRQIMKPRGMGESRRAGPATFAFAPYHAERK
jgi:hypothetical protein